MGNNYYSKGRKKIGLFSLLRDWLISTLPYSLAKAFAKASLPFEPDFIFLTHPRNDEDISATVPFMGIVKKLNAPLYSFIKRRIPCALVAEVEAPKGKRGYFLSVFERPEVLFQRRELTARLIEGIVSFSKKIASHKMYIGLAAWWPIVSNSGLFFEKHLKNQKQVLVTSGHTATVTSLYLSVLGVAHQANIPLNNLSVLIVGVGKIGGAVASKLASQVRKIGLLDKNGIRLETVKRSLSAFSTLNVETIQIQEAGEEDLLLQTSQKYDVVIGTTSNTGLLIKDARLLKNSVIIDDARPEAFPRKFSVEENVVVLEGGLMKIPGVKIDSDFGFGKEDNLFGCLSEAIMLSVTAEEDFKPSIGEIDFDNLNQFILACKKNGVTVGDFKCAQRAITGAEIASILNASRHVN